MKISGSAKEQIQESIWRPWMQGQFMDCLARTLLFSRGYTITFTGLWLLWKVNNEWATTMGRFVYRGHWSWKK